MSKKITISGKEYKTKFLERIAVKNNSAALFHHNKLSIYNKYAIVIKNSDGSSNEYYSDDDQTKYFDVILYRGNPNEILFKTPDCQEKWKHIFIYLFNDDNSYFMCANSENISEVGAWYVSANLCEYEALRKNVLNCADWFKEKLSSRILNIELNEKEDVSLIYKGE